MGSVMEVARGAPSAGTQVERTSPLRIAHVGDSMEMGGAEKLTATLCRLQRDRGHIASVHCLYRLGVLGEWDQGYLTMDFEAEAAIAAELLKSQVELKTV